MKFYLLIFILLTGCSYEENKEIMENEAMDESLKLISTLDSVYEIDNSYANINSTFIQNQNIKTEIKSSFLKTQLYVIVRESEYSISFSLGLFGPSKVYSSKTKSWEYEE